MDLVNLDEIIIGERFRNNPGNVSDLVDSIGRIGLLHPIVISNDYRLIAGHRRYLAFKKLGETAIPCTIVDLPLDNEKKAEAEENTVRVDFTNSEIYSIQQYFHETESRPAGRPTNEQKEIRSDSEQIKKPIEQTARTTGKHPDTISKINQVMEAKSEDPLVQKQLDEIKENVDKQSVDKLYKEVKQLTRSTDDQPDPEFLIKLLVDKIKRQDEGGSILAELYEILDYPNGNKLLKKRLSYYK